MLLKSITSIAIFLNFFSTFINLQKYKSSCLNTSKKINDEIDRYYANEKKLQKKNFICICITWSNQKLWYFWTSFASFVSFLFFSFRQSKKILLWRMQMWDWLNVNYENGKNKTKQKIKTKTKTKVERTKKYFFDDVTRLFLVRSCNRISPHQTKIKKKSDFIKFQKKIRSFEIMFLSFNLSYTTCLFIRWF